MRQHILTSFFLPCPVSNLLKDLKPKPKLLPKGVPEHVPQEYERVLLEAKRVSEKVPQEFLERQPPDKVEVEETTFERVPGKVPESMREVEESPKLVVHEKVLEKVPEKPPKTVPEKAALQRKLTEEKRTTAKLPAELPTKVDKVKPEVLSKKDTEKISVERLPLKVLDKKSEKASEAQPEQAPQALKAPATGTIDGIYISLSLAQSVPLQHLLNRGVASL